MSATGFSNTNTHSVFHSMHLGKSLMTLVSEVELLVCARCKSSRGLSAECRIHLV